VLVGGAFAAAEIALVSLRESQIRALAERGRRGAKVAKLAADPNRFLASVQIGVTLAGFLSAAFGAATLADDLTPVLVDAGLPGGIARTLALITITLAISYVSLVLGELAPKRLALQRAEGFALAVAPTLDRIATMSRPVIWLLSRSTDAVVRLFGGDPAASREAITQEELRDLVAAHESLSKDERELIEEVFAAGERQVREVLVPRTEVDFLDAALPISKATEIVAAKPHSRYPVVRGSYDNVVGFVHVRDLLMPTAKRAARVGDVAREVKLLPATKRVLPALSEMRRERHHLAIVVDEYGGTAGIVTLEDLVEELVGDIRDEYDAVHPGARRLRGGAVEVEGLLNLDEFAEVTGIELPDGPYETVAGYIVATLGRLPVVGDVVETAEHCLKVVEMDGRRVARLLVTPAPRARQQPPEPTAEPPAAPLPAAEPPAAEPPAATAEKPAGDSTLRQ
jgi:putative hemolysin